jgi:hypothetical protein
VHRATRRPVSRCAVRGPGPKTLAVQAMPRSRGTSKARPSRCPARATSLCPSTPAECQPALGGRGREDPSPTGGSNDHRERGRPSAITGPGSPGIDDKELAGAPAAPRAPMTQMYGMLQRELGEIVVATRKPKEWRRRCGEAVWRLAERRSVELFSQEPPRRIRLD